jgi:hypothetical protein
MKRGLAALFSTLWLLAWSGCSNPFSGDHGRAANYHTPNVNCQQLRLDKSEFDVREFRGLVHCLNSDGQIQELEAFLSTLPDAELSAASDLVNVLLNQDLKTLYTIRETYEQLKAKKLLQPALEEVASLETIAPVAPAAAVIADVAFDRELGLSVNAFRHTLESAAAKRAITQFRKGDDWERTLRQLDTYLAGNPEFNLRALYRILLQSGITLPQEPKSVTQVAAFLETIFAQKNMGGFTEVLGKALQQPLQCFDKSLVVFDPIDVATHRILTGSPADTKTLLETQARALLLTARGYCTIPYSAEPLFRFTDPLLGHPGFDTSYRFLLPLLRSKDFVRFIIHPASRDWVASSAYLANQNLFQDLFALTAINPALPLTRQPERAAAYLDRLFAGLSADEVVRLGRVVAPLLRDLSRSPLLDIEAALPEFDLQIDDSLRTRLKQLSIAAMRSPQLETLLPMMKRLVRENRLIPIWDEVFRLFDRRVLEGRNPLRFAKAPKLPARAETWKPVLLEKIRYQSAPSRCAGVDTDLAFIDRNLRGSRTWLALDQCFGGSSGSRATLAAGKELSDFAAARGKLSAVTGMEADLINTAFKVDRESTLNLLTQFVDIRGSDSDAVRKSLQAVSSAVRLVQPNIAQSPELRRILGEGAEDPRLYRAMIELHQNAGRPIGNRVMTLTPLSTVDTWVEPRVSQPTTVVQGIQRLMQEYCPSLDLQDKNCDVEDDQVQLFRSNPTALANQVIDESIGRSSSWLHPALAKTWSHTGADEVRDFEYQFYPLLHEFRASEGLGEAIFGFFGRYRNKVRDLQEFIQVHGRHYSLIPYIHHDPSYPKNGKREYFSRIRLKLVSDLDRLELVAINTDFRPFNIITHMGMKFIRQIALSWGDEPAGGRPPGTTAQTLASTTEDINQLVAQLDRESLSKLGECDPRGKSRVGRWLQQTVCKGEIADLSVRVFNLRFLTQLFVQMQVREAGGNDGMRILRDLFYALYSTNPPRQADRFGKGADIPEACRRVPRSGPTPEECRLDQLTLVPRMTRLGLLHQAGLTAAFTPGSSLNETLQMLSEVSSLTPVKNQLTAWLAQPRSTQTLLSIKNWVAALPETASSDPLHIALKAGSQLRPYDWVSSVISAFEAEPLLIEKLSEPLHLWVNSSTVPATEPSAWDRSPLFRAWTSARLVQMNPAASRELTALFLTIARQPERLTSLIRQSRAVPDFNQPAIERELYRWLGKFASPDAAAERAALKRSIQGPKLDEFCDVFSDSPLVDKTYNFLERIHQNPDSDRFFATCRAFLFR